MTTGTSRSHSLTDNTFVKQITRLFKSKWWKEDIRGLTWPRVAFQFLMYLTGSLRRWRREPGVCYSRLNPYQGHDQAQGHEKDKNFKWTAKVSQIFTISVQVVLKGVKKNKALSQAWTVTSLGNSPRGTGYLQKQHSERTNKNNSQAKKSWEIPKKTSVAAQRSFRKVKKQK